MVANGFVHFVPHLYFLYLWRKVSIVEVFIVPSRPIAMLSPDQIHFCNPDEITSELRRIHLISDPLQAMCSLARCREVSGVVYVPGNMAASFRGRPIRSLRMRGKHEKPGSVLCVLLRYCKNRFPEAGNDLGMVTHVDRGVCFWQVGMTAGKRTYRWIWPEVSRGFITSHWKRLLFNMDGQNLKTQAFSSENPMRVFFLSLLLLFGLFSLVFLILS